jgi:Kef-type K+ transport system membrane component KefB
MEQISFFPLLVISGLAFAVPIVASRIRGGLVPIVVAEIIAGIIFGRAGFGIIESNVWLPFLSQFGFAYLMFLSGLEVDFGQLSNRRAAGKSLLGFLLDNPLLTGLVLFALTLGGAGLGAWWLFGNAPVTHVLFMALILSTTSSTVVPILKEKGITRDQFGQIILMSAMVADFLTIFLITILAGILASDNLFHVGLIASLFALFYILTRWGRKLQTNRLAGRVLNELAHATAQLQVRGALALMLVFVVLAEAVRAELVLGAFLAGAVISSLSREESSALRIKLDAIGYGFFVPIFFITVGAQFDITALQGSSRSLILIPALVAIAYGVKIVPSLILTARFPLRQALGAGVLLSTRLTLIIAASVIGLRFGVIDEAMNSAIILVAIVTSTISPALFNMIFTAIKHPRGRVIIVGAGDVGRLLALKLMRQQVEPVLMEIDPKRAAEVRGLGLEVVTGSGLLLDTLTEAGTDGASAFIAATPDDDVNLRACQLASDNFNLEHIISRVNIHTRMNEFTEAGIKAVSRGMAMAITLDNIVMRPDLFDLIADPAGESEIIEIPLRNTRFIGSAVQNIYLPGDAIILLIHRDEVSFVPHPSTVLERNDLITIAGDKESVEEAARVIAAEDRLMPI